MLRVAELNTLPLLVIQDRTDKVFFGSWVTLLGEDDVEVVYRIVGPDEFDPDKGWISMDSPVGRSLLSREVGDEITVRRPRGEATCEIVDVRNTPPD